MNEPKITITSEKYHENNEYKQVETVLSILEISGLQRKHSTKSRKFSQKEKKINDLNTSVSNSIVSALCARSHLVIHEVYECSSQLDLMYSGRIICM